MYGSEEEVKKERNCNRIKATVNNSKHLKHNSFEKKDQTLNFGLIGNEVPSVFSKTVSVLIRSRYQKLCFNHVGQSCIHVVYVKIKTNVNYQLIMIIISVFYMMVSNGSVCVSVISPCCDL